MSTDGGLVPHIILARSPEEPQFGVALLKLVVELRRNRRLSLEQAMARALHGMRVDREAFRRYVVANRERYQTAAQGVRTVESRLRPR